MTPPTIYQYIKSEENSFQTQKIQLGKNWFWNLKDHIELIFHLKNGQFYTGDNDWMRAFKNIMEPMLNLAYWTEDIDVKDVQFFIESDNGRALSFLIKKYHDERYVREHDLDTLFDEITESDVDYGGVMVQETNGERPEVLQLNSIAFCDQTDILGSPIAFKHYFAPDKLRQMSKLGWGKPENGATISLNELAMIASQEKTPAGSNAGKKNQVPGKTVEVYITRGSLPAEYMEEGGGMEDWYGQVHVTAFYYDKDNKQQGVTLYRKKDEGDSLRFHTSQKVHGRALGRGVGESLLHPQIWTNFLTIHKQGMLEAAGKIVLYTDDPAYTDKNKVVDMNNLEITTIEDGKTIGQVPTAGVANIQLYANDIEMWYQHAQLGAAAFDPLLGKEQSSGTTFKGQERTVAQGRGIHDRRRGQRAKFIEQLYRDFIIPDMVREIKAGKTFLATLSAEEMTWVVDQLATNYANRRTVEAVIEAFEKGKPVPTAEDQAAFQQTFKEIFSKSGNQKLVEILDSEFKDVEVRIGINIAGKQKDLAMLSDKLLSIFQYIFANPAGFQQAMQIPALSHSFNSILEYSGINQADFASLLAPPQQPVALPNQPLEQPQAQQAATGL